MKRVDVACALLFDAEKEAVLMVKNRRGDACDYSLSGGGVDENRWNYSLNPRMTGAHATTTGAWSQSRKIKKRTAMPPAEGRPKMERLHESCRQETRPFMGVEECRRCSASPLWGCLEQPFFLLSYSLP
ncbi:hypothetical protein CEN49_27295 [Fischerella thermalis CCMEE 5273]|nr:hypothetical protein CEN49_27295 [Fischerella thermalis CCMEE 5273]